MEEKKLNKYKVSIIETLQLEVEIEADSAAEAKSIVENDTTTKNTFLIQAISSRSILWPVPLSEAGVTAVDSAIRQKTKSREDVINIEHQRAAFW